MKSSRPDCPKHMAYGPCGGVAPDGRCEAVAHPCPFVADPATDWPAPWPGHARAEDPLVPPVIADVRVFPDEWERVAEAVAPMVPAVDAALVGDHAADRRDAPPELVAPRVAKAGIATIATLACRGRTRDEYGAAVASLLDAGVTTILCVTGDHPAALRAGERGDGGRDSTFPTESFECIGVARDEGATVAVAESPDSPPGSGRVARLARKVDAGAQLCFVNHCADPRGLVDFVVAARAAGVGIPFVAPIPAVTDRTSSTSLEHLPGMRVPRVFETGAAAHGGDHAHVAACELVERLRGEGRFAAFNLSGRAHAGHLDARCAAMAELARAVRPFAVRP